MTAARKPRLARWLCAVAAAVLLAACSALRPGPSPEAPPKPAVPQITEAQLRDKAKDSLALGLREYQAGDYDDATKNLGAALDHGLLSHAEQSKARKNLAFIYCMTDHEPQCRDEFRKAMEIDPGFDLTPAEAGHPIWGPIYRNVRAQLVAPVAAAPKPAVPRTPGQQLLADGMAKYDAGEFDAALKLLRGALKEGLEAKADQVKAHKQAAFSLCLLRRITLCRDEFLQIFAIDADFSLAPAEAGHPSWAKSYAAAKQRAAQAREKAAKGAGSKK
jgi:tetratricopeptide (TPR) repeat protein